MKEIPKTYNPQKVEDKIYKKWEESGKFNPDNLELPEDAEKFSISMPPPNATGVLHLGHASMLAYQDLMIRYNRMQEKNTLWLPGTDHASIATQTKVEKIIAGEGKTKYDLGREKFLERVNEYVENSKNTIRNQTKRMGSSCDWEREKYTLDDGLSRAVREVFVKMYNDELIYRGDRIINWCPRCESTLADDEVEHKDQKANLYYFKYNKDFPITIATTRPETKLGDTAVAVNPKDERYQKYIGQVFEIDLGNGAHQIKIIANREVNMDFGSGALGVTPAHSMTDWEMAEENDLEKIKIIEENGKMSGDAGKDYEGLKVFEAREKFVQYLEDNNLIEKIEKVDQSLSICYRCDTPIEPLPSLQWFVNVDKKITIEGNKYFQNKSLKDVALEVVKNKEIKIIPERFEKTYFNWMENLHDWCISRQLWFGHRIPVWYKELKVHKVESQENFVFLRGFLRNSNVEDPLNWLNEKLSNKNNFYCELPNSDKPNLQEQMDFVMDNAKINENTTIVAHSIGCILAMKLIEKNDLKIKKLVLISPPMQTQKTVDGKARKELKNYGNGKFDFNKIKKLVDKAIVFSDSNDHIILPNEPKVIAEKLDAKFVEIEAPVSHFNCEKCEEILEELKINSKFKIQNSKFNQEVYVGVELPEGEDWTQDKDTLDTWFSSGLWTFSTLLDQDHEKYKTFEEWVANSSDLEKFHPTSVMETGYDLLFFWIARMILMTTYTLGEVPFENVYLHGMVRDKQGKKMSKSLGNGIDPIDMIEKYGTDALRLSMIIGSSPGNDIKMYEEKIEGYRNFVNKLWNISRYISQKSIKSKVKSASSETLGEQINSKDCSIVDLWILKKMLNLIYEVNFDLMNYNFSSAGEKLRDFTWNDFADWYLEANKLEDNKQGEMILNIILQDLLKLWHPFIPFVTEEIWKNLYFGSLLIIEKWPTEDNYKKIIEGTSTTYYFEPVARVVEAIRSARSQYKIEPSKKIEAVIYAGKQNELIESQSHLIKGMRTGIDKLEIKEKGDKIKDAVYVVVGNIEIYLMGIIDKEKEKNNLEKKIENIEKYIQQIRNKLGNDNFVANAPREVVEKERNKFIESEAKLKKLKEKLKFLSDR